MVLNPHEIHRSEYDRGRISRPVRSRSRNDICQTHPRARLRLRGPQRQSSQRFGAEHVQWQEDLSGVHPEDNTGAIALAGKRGSHKRSKHIDLKFHWIQKQVEDGQLLPVYVESAKNPADLLTKGVSRDTRERLRPMLLHEHEAAVVREPSKGHKTP